MKYGLIAALFLAAIASFMPQARAQQTAIVVTNCGAVAPGPGTYPTGTPASLTMDVNGRLCGSGGTSNPTSTLTTPATTTTAYSSGQLVASSATAGSIVVPSFSIPSAAGGPVIPRLRLNTNDTSTGWQGATVNIDLWSAAPTFTNGDRGVWLPATGSLNHLGTYNCTFPAAVWGDGLTAECAPAVGTVSVPKLASGVSIFWSLEATSTTNAVTASKTFTLTAELLN